MIKYNKAYMRMNYSMDEFFEINEEKIEGDTVVLDVLKEKDENRILNLFKKYDLPMYTKGFDISEIYGIMKHDKKVFDNKIHFIMLESIGKALIHDNTPAELLLKSLSEVCLNEK